MELPLVDSQAAAKGYIAIVVGRCQVCLAWYIRRALKFVSDLTILRPGFHCEDVDCQGVVYMRPPEEQEVYEAAMRIGGEQAVKVAIKGMAHKDGE